MEDLTYALYSVLVDSAGKSPVGPPSFHEAIVVYINQLGHLVAVSLINHHTTLINMSTYSL